MTGERLKIQAKREIVTARTLAWTSAVALTWGCGWVLGCAKTDVQAPAKEAPSTAAAAEEPRAEGATAAPPPGNPVNPDRWPQAESVPGAAQSPAGGAPKTDVAPALAPAPMDKSKEQKKSEAARSRGAAKPSKGGLGAAEESEVTADQLEPALAAGESWSQLNVAFDELSTALALAVPDCGTADRFRQNVCALAERICTLERELPSTAVHNCTDGRKRCSEATSRYSTKCDN